MEWFQCGYLPRRGDDDAVGDADDLRACTLTSCFPRNAGEDDEEKPALVRVYPGGWGFAVGSSADGAVWTWGACREYLAEGVAGDGRPRRGAGRAHPASAGFATVVSCARETDERIDDARSSEVRVRVEGWRGVGNPPNPPNPPSDDRAPHTVTSVTFLAARNTPPTRLRPGSAMPATRRARHLAAGDEHFLLVTDAGEAFRGEFRGAGAGARVAALVFDAGAPGSDGTIPRDVKITHVAAGSRHSALVDADGRVWTFGWGLYGQLGHETCEDASDPKPVAALGACFARAVAAGAAHTSVLVSTGGVYAFGSNQDGQLGVPPSACALGAATATPELVEFPWDDERRVERASVVTSWCTSVSAVSCGARHTACVTSRGALVVWGWNAYGQLGVGDRETREAPTRVAAPARAEKKKARAVACGRWHTVVSYGDDGKPP